METKNNEIMAKALMKDAWDKLSEEFSWNEQLLERYKDKVNWDEVSRNKLVDDEVSQLKAQMLQEKE